jgi:hypothetical protein
MVTIYSPPEGIDPPAFEDYMDENGRYNRELSDRLDEDYLHRLGDYCRRYGKGRYTGYVWHYPVADGAARYMVFSLRPFTLIHIPLHDAWHIPEVVARGLRTKDITEYADAEPIFGGQPVRYGFWPGVKA